MKHPISLYLLTINVFKECIRTKKKDLSPEIGEMTAMTFEDSGFQRKPERG